MMHISLRWPVVDTSLQRCMGKNRWEQASGKEATRREVRRTTTDIYTWLIH